MTRPRRRGRPALTPGEASVELCLNVSREDYVALVGLAADDGHASIQQVIRHAIARLIIARRRRRPTRTRQTDESTQES